MILRVISVRYLSGYSLWLTFSDGSEGTVDLSAELYGEVFDPLKSLEEFQKVTVSEEFGTVVWPNGADFAPEYLRERLQEAA